MRLNAFMAYEFQGRALTVNVAKPREDRGGERRSGFGGEHRSGGRGEKRWGRPVVAAIVAGKLVALT